MKPFALLLVAVGCLVGIPLAAQKRVPYAFAHQGIPPKESQLKVLTEVTQPGSSFLRLYFKGTQLGETSYLLLEAPDGARQELRAADLQNWNFSSAYFNGGAVKVSLFAAVGEKNTVRVSELKVTDEQAERARNARQAAGGSGNSPRTVASTAADILETYPYAKAVGRFTDGSQSFGTGWIAPNGAIVTSYQMYDNYDVIEFNVPPSVGITVSHPSPQDQYPLLVRTPPHESTLYFKDVSISFFPATGWMLFDPQPNGTGLRPGERQQEYFRIATNPRNSTINEQGDGNMHVDIFHYGVTSSDYLQGSTTYLTLRLSQTHLLPQNDNLKISNGDRDRFVLYQLPSWGGSDGGAPITFAGTNVAIGVHNFGTELNLGAGRGFRDDDFRNELNDYFFSNSVYVDFDGPPSGATGEIHKPYLSAQEAASNAPSGAQVYIARNTYLGPVTFNRPMTLRAPVGTVMLGVNPVAARRAAGPAIPPHWLEGAPSPAVEDQSAEDRRVGASPNPFRGEVTVSYQLAAKGPVSVAVFNGGGAEVARLVSGEAEAGSHTVRWGGTDRSGAPVAPGLYVVRVNSGNQTITTKLLKQ